MSEIESRVEVLAAPIAAAHGCELVQVRFRRGRRSSVLAVFLDAARPDPTPAETAAAERAFDPGSDAPPAPYEGSPVSVDTCADVSGELGAVIDAEDLVHGRYVLEVSSPGLERPLHLRKDWIRFRGHEIDLRVAQSSGGPRRFRALLAAVRGGSAVVIPREDGPGGPAGAAVEVPLQSVLAARLVYHGTASPKPGGRRSRNRGVR